MQSLIDQGKIRGWGLCNDNAYGLTACTRTAKALGTTPPCTLQGDYSVLDRKADENGVAEAASPYNENVGFLAYNALAGGMLTGKVREITNNKRAPTNRMQTVFPNFCLTFLFLFWYHHCFLLFFSYSTCSSHQHWMI
jgi:aryl-alcohol dehydrogenase-like predicted oxidoreductase